MQYPNPKFLLQDPTDDDSQVSLLDDSLVAEGFSSLWLLHRHGSGVADLVVNTLGFVLCTKAYIVHTAYIVHFTKVPHLPTLSFFFLFLGVRFWPCPKAKDLVFRFIIEYIVA